MASNVTGNPGKNLPIILAKYQKAIQREMRAICLETERTAKQNLTDLGKVDRGFTRSSVDSEVETIAGQVEGVVFAGTLWAPWIEFGRHGTKSSPVGTGSNSADPAFPPIEPIRDWVRRNRRKLGIKSSNKRDSAGKFLAGTNSTEIEGAAFAIARKIQEKGIAPTPFLIPAFLSVSPFYKARIVQAVLSVKDNFK